MEPADMVLSRWREAGRWWDGEPYVEVTRRLNPRGRVVEELREMPCLGDPLLAARAAAHAENAVGGLDTRFVKVRDEKVAQALGLVAERRTRPLRPASEPYALLHACSGYAFGCGAMLADEVPAIAASKGISAALLADPFSLAGAMEFSESCRLVGIKPLLGASVTLPEGGEIVLVCRNRTGWRSLCRLLTECHEGEPRLFPLATWERLERHAEGLACLTGGELGPLARLLPARRYDEARRFLWRLVGLYGRNEVGVQIERSYMPWERVLNDQLLHLAGELRIPALAGGLVTHAARSHFPAQDTIACIHSLCGIEDVAGRKPTRHESQPSARDAPARWLNAERFVRSAEEMTRHFRDRPELVRNTRDFADLCDADVLPGRASLPRLDADEPAALRAATYAGAARVYRSLPDALDRRIERELGTICDQGYAGHFLVAHEMVEWAAMRGIHHSGRGSVVDSVVAYCLGLSRIDAHARGLAFERFLPAEGTKRPDIDIDFESGRREEVRGHLMARYGSEHVATVGAYGAMGTRGILREVGKVMGLPEESVSGLARMLHGGVSPKALEDALEKRPELRGADVPRERLRWVFALAERLTDVPRGLRAHPSGIVLSREPLRDIVPVVPSAVDGVRLLQWDKRSAKRCFDKFDVLCLRAMDILSHAEGNVRLKDRTFSADAVPVDDPETFRAMRAGDLIGITQSASPAMTSAHVRVRTDSLADAALVQACIRPGVGGAIKNDLLVERKFGAPYALEHPLMEPIVGRTYGIVVYQEQVDQLLTTFAGYTDGEAEEIREGIYKRRREGYILSVQEEIKARIVGRGFGLRMAETVYDLVAPYQGYGFAEGHALAFAEASVRSLWIKVNHPAEFLAAALEAQPAGYYPAHTLANEARGKGVTILPLDVNASGLAYATEDVRAEEDPKVVFPNGGIRLPLSRVEGVSLALAARVVAARACGPYLSLGDFALRTKPDEDELARLVLAGAFDALHPNRRGTRWGVPAAMQYARSFGPDPNALPFEVAAPFVPDDLPDFLRAERSLMERRLLGLDVAHHLVAYERERLSSRGALSTREVKEMALGNEAMVAGNPIRLRMPPTRSGRRVVFFDLEDEHGLLNLTVFDDVYARCGHALVTEPYVLAWVRAQDRQGHRAYLVSRLIPYRPTFAGEPPRTGPLPLVVGDFLHT